MVRLYERCVRWKNIPSFVILEHRLSKTNASAQQHSYKSINKTADGCTSRFAGGIIDVLLKLVEHRQ